MSGRPRVLVLTPYFVPGQQGGGSALAVRYLVEQLGDAFEFVVATGDRDFAAARPYTADEQAGARRQLGVDICYLPEGPRRIGSLWGLLNQPFDLLYLNSLLSPSLGLLPLLMRRFSKARHAALLIAPRGELKQELLAMKSGRKRLYLKLLKRGGLLDEARLHATSEAEQRDLSALGLAPVHRAADLAPTQAPALPPPGPPDRGPLRIAFVSRIDQNKNLAQVLRVLASTSVPVQLDIAGPVGDAAYWQACRRAIAQLPAHVSVRQLGPLPHDEVLRLMGEQEVFFLPTWSENHGYVIHEALLAGCMLLISDRTPWRHLDRLGVGHDLPLDDDRAFANAIEVFARLPMTERLAIRRRAQSYGFGLLQGDDERQGMARLLRQAIKAP